MKRTIPVPGFFFLAALFLWAQRERSAPAYLPFEVRSVFPREIRPGIFEQVSPAELQALSQQGWELVSVAPWVYRNEERGPELQGPKPVVLQTYPAYFFKRTRIAGARE